MDEDLLRAIYTYTNKNKLDVRKDYDKRGTVYRCKDLEICFGSYWFKIFIRINLLRFLIFLGKIFHILKLI